MNFEDGNVIIPLVNGQPGLSERTSALRNGFVPFEAMDPLPAARCCGEQRWRSPCAPDYPGSTCEKPDCSCFSWVSARCWNSPKNTYKTQCKFTVNLEERTKHPHAAT